MIVIGRRLPTKGKEMLRPEEIRAAAITAASIYLNELPRWAGYHPGSSDNRVLRLAEKFEDYILHGKKKEKE